MATAAEPKATRVLEAEQRVMLPGVGWEGYEALLKLIGDGHTRVTYDRGDAELMAPSDAHEEYAELIGLVIRAVASGFGIPCRGLRSTTWRKRDVDQGLEADNCYYLTNAPRVGRKRGLDLNADPPPDLAVEVEISRGALNRLRIYAGLGVPEVWRFDGERLVIHRLQPDGTYATINESLEVPAITPDEVVRWVRENESIGDDTEWDRRLREWVRDELLPRHQGR
jgi:Uma2 family endonuclease